MIFSISGLVKTSDTEQGGLLQKGERGRLEQSKRRADYDAMWRYFMKIAKVFHSITSNFTELSVNHREESAA